MPANRLTYELQRIALRLELAVLDAERADTIVEGRYDRGKARHDLAVAARSVGRVIPVGDASSDERTALVQRIADVEATCAHERATATPIGLHALRARLGLDDLAFDLLLLVLAPDIDELFGRVLQWMQGGAVTDRILRVATAAQVLTPDDLAGGRIRRLLSPGGAFFDRQLIDLSTEGCYLSTALRVPTPVLLHALDQPPSDASLEGTLRVEHPRTTRAETYLSDDVFDQLAVALADRSTLPLLFGPDGAAQQAAVRAFASETGRPVCELDVSRTPRVAHAGRIARLAWLAEALLVVKLPAAGDDDAGLTADLAQGLEQLVRQVDGPIVLWREIGTGTSPGAIPLPVDRTLIPIRVGLPSAAERTRAFRDHLGATTVALERAGRIYPMGADAIRQVGRRARAAVDARSPGAAVDDATLLAHVTTHFAPRMEGLGRRIDVRHTLDQLVLAAETSAALDELIATVKTRHRVLDEWGLSSLLHGRGIPVLFHGEPGGGKTLAAGVVSAAAGLPLYQIDVSQLASKWIGETEKNLSRLFRTAEASCAMLLFDEADAMFGKRTDVKQSNDRYANMQTNFLLSLIEAFDGVVILTTNRDAAIDPAFQRRIQFRVHFPMPEPPEREALWRGMVARVVGPVGTIDYPELARRLEMSGGYIRNAVLRGAHLAAAGVAPIDTSILLRAAELVLTEAGRIC